MKAHISTVERKVLAVLQEGLPESLTPYRDMAQRLGMETGELLALLERWKRQGRLRRIGAVVNHFKVGLGAGAMVVWKVEPERVAEVGRILAGFEETSHVYERQVGRNWPYNMYSMVHGASDQEVLKAVERMSRACGVCEYRVLVTEKELKKAPPTYVT
jgi:DNA-binding Lrp family transcriptional regulator